MTSQKNAFAYLSRSRPQILHAHPAQLAAQPLLAFLCGQCCLRCLDFGHFLFRILLRSQQSFCLRGYVRRGKGNSQQKTASRKQPAENSQQKTASSQQPAASSEQYTLSIRQHTSALVDYYASIVHPYKIDLTF
jgi:hypothetical protein